MRKKLVILSGLIAVNSLSYASGYDWQTPTENNWHVVIANGEMNYADGTILGGNGTAAAPEPSVISADKGGVAKIISPGTLNFNSSSKTWHDTQLVIWGICLFFHGRNYDQSDDRVDF